MLSIFKLAWENKCVDTDRFLRHQSQDYASITQIMKSYPCSANHDCGFSLTTCTWGSRCISQILHQKILTCCGVLSLYLTILRWPYLSPCPSWGRKMRWISQWFICIWLFYTKLYTHVYLKVSGFIPLLCCLPIQSRSRVYCYSSNNSFRFDIQVVVTLSPVRKLIKVCVA